METLPSNSSLNLNKNSNLSNLNDKSKYCIECKKPIKGSYITAMDGVFHLDCFRCVDCKEICLSKFFTYKMDDGTFRPLCENDYYKRLDFVCAKCGKAILDIHINAIGKKYHVEHFCCAKCSKDLRSESMYFEHDGDVYCQKDFFQYFAQKCGSCRIPVLQQYVEHNNIKTKTIEILHLDCYNIYKAWNVRMVPEYVPPKKYSSIEEELDDKNRMEERIARVWSILKIYRESAAQCVEKLLNYVNSNSIDHEIEQAKTFVFHIEVLFNALDEIEKKMCQFNDTTGLHLEDEPKKLVRKIIYFFSTITHSTTISHDYTKEFLSLINLLAQTLKLLIRTALNCVIKLEYIYNQPNEMENFLNHIVEIEDTQKDLSFFSRYDKELENEMDIINTEYCSFCKQYILEDCIANNNYRWHSKCFKCTSCSKSLINEKKEISGFRVKTDNNGIILICPGCVKAQNIAISNLSSEFQFISQFVQYKILLRTSLKRLYILCPQNTKLSESLTKLKVTMSKNSNLLSKTKINDIALIKKQDNVANVSNDNLMNSIVEENINKNVNEITASTDNIYLKSGDDTNNSNRPIKNQISKIKTQDVEPMNNMIITPREINRYEFDNDSEVGFDKYHDNNNSLSTYANPYANAYNDIYQSYNIKSEESNKMSPNESEKMDFKKDNNEKENDNFKGSNNSLLTKFKNKGTLPENIITLRRSTTEDYKQSICISSVPLDENQILFSDLSPFQMLAVTQKIVECLSNLLKKENLSSQIDLSNLLLDKKETMWGKLLGSLKQNQKKQKVKDKTFGVSLDFITEKHGIESKFGAGSGNIKIPILIEELITSMRGMDLNVEGIYRKNGNIKQLKLLSDNIDKNPDEINLKGNSPIQLAALMKKFLRELPNPVLTYKLHQLFIISQKASTEENSLKILNYTCCLLPKSHRDLLEVLLLFLKHISTLTDNNNNSGTKMNAENLATVIAPNILYSKYKDPAKDESLLAIKAVRKLIDYPELSFIVPENIVKMLNLNEEKENTGDIIINNINHGKTITKNNYSNFKNSTSNLYNIEQVQYDEAV
ncbi:RhoGAP-domain-containing protein [Piromyces finnis]|uniref:RhoGAP-domain-containing protein n=1 Tax=Piromyces finnis TaxID=1754191 RepID=A0A1Y1VEB1_9FUNG|nr:RhoGAP-domain-containing protein [Piromyces finnis]|eukprot:ORX53859.1 RhoGAP-domain-containing protein [Piromyces finnis]